MICCLRRYTSADGMLPAVYFVQGILGLSRLGVSFLYKDEFQLDPASVRLTHACVEFIVAMHTLL